MSDEEQGAAACGLAINPNLYQDVIEPLRALGYRLWRAPHGHRVLTEEPFSDGPWTAHDLSELRNNGVALRVVKS